MSIQGCLLILMYFYYTSRPLAGVVFPVLYGGIVYVLASGLTPMSVLTKFASFNIGLLATSRVSCRTLLMLFFFFLNSFNSFVVHSCDNSHLFCQSLNQEAHVLSLGVVIIFLLSCYFSVFSVILR